MIFDACRNNRHAYCTRQDQSGEKCHCQCHHLDDLKFTLALMRIRKERTRKGERQAKSRRSRSSMTASGNERNF